MGSGGFFAILLFIFLLILTGGILPLFIEPFISNEDIKPNTLSSHLINIIDEGLEIDLPLIEAFNLDIFFFLPQFIKDYFISQITYMSFIPNYVLIPLLIVMFMCLVYAVASFVPTIPGG